MNAKPKHSAKPKLKVVEPARELARIVVTGHVDHGKSTLVGRLFHDTDSLPDGKFEAIQASCRRRGIDFEWAFLMDAFQAERDQGVTIDSSQAWFRTKARDYTIIDAPGHREFIKNMLTGAAQADAALVVIDCLEGVQEQSRKHGYLLHLIGISHVVVAVNKMDANGYDQARFEEVEAEYRRFLAGLGIHDVHIVPVSAREGDNVVSRSGNMPWYKGLTLIDAVDTLPVHAPLNDQPLRMSVQDVYKYDNRRIIAGRIESGQLRVGDEVMFSPSNKTARIASLEVWPEDAEQPRRAVAGQSIGLTLDVQTFVERGDLMSHTDDLPVETDVFEARVFWFGRKPLTAGATYKAKINTTEARLVVERITSIVNVDDLSVSDAEHVERNQVADVVLRAKRILAVDEFESFARTGRFVLHEDHNIAGGGVIAMRGYADQRDLITQRATNITRVSHGVDREEREKRNGHTGGVLWFTGLSGSGKSTLAVSLERRLFDLGYNAFVVDGDNVRHGLNANLGFSPEDRAENIRRVGELSALFARSGMLVITAFISPYRSDRERARTATGGHYHEIYIKADLATCEQRDPKGLYKKARAGEIPDFTGISAPYEAPDAPEFEVDTAAKSAEDCVDELISYVETHFRKRI